MPDAGSAERPLGELIDGVDWGAAADEPPALLQSSARFFSTFPWGGGSRESAEGGEQGDEGRTPAGEA